jgi:hypothetical protein
LEIHFLPAISPDNKTYEELRIEVFEVMKNYYVAHSSVAGK